MITDSLYIFFSYRRESELSDTPHKPVFAQLLTDTTIIEGERLKLSAAINAHPEPEVKANFHFFVLF